MEEMQRFPMSEILKKFETKNDRINFCRENSKLLFFNIIDFYLPSHPGFDTKFFVQFLAGTKKVKYNYLFCIASPDWFRKRI